MAASSSRSSGIGFSGLLTVLFIGLKLTEYIDWSWWWVLSPVWMPLCIILVFLAIAWVAILGKHLYDKHQRKLRTQKMRDIKNH